MLECWAVLAVILSRLHFEDVGNDAVNRDVTYQASEEELLCDAGVHEAQGRETSQDPGQPGGKNTTIPAKSSWYPVYMFGVFFANKMFL